MIEGSFRLPGARPVSALAIDCIEEFWFDSVDEMKAAFTSTGYTKRISPIAQRLFNLRTQRSALVEERVFLDKQQSVV